MIPPFAISPGSHDFPVYLATQFKNKKDFGLAPQDEYTGKLNVNTKLHKWFKACLLGTGEAVR